MVKENIFGNGGEEGRYETIQKNLEDFLRQIFEQEYRAAFRRSDGRQTELYNSRMKYFRIPFEICRVGQRAESFIKNRSVCILNK